MYVSLQALTPHICDVTLKRFPLLAEDSTREYIDNILSSVLGLPDLEPLRGAPAEEPVVCLDALA